MAISSALGSSALLPAGLGFRNVIINGEMQVHQRGGTSTVVNANNYNLDRWYGFSSGTFTMQQSTDVPSETTFSNSLLATCTTADTSIAASDFNSISQRIEGYASASIGYGTSSKPNVLSFWVKSSLTGTYCVSFRNNAVNRSYVAEYTINSANTWEKKLIYLTSDIVGTWEKTNGIGVRLDFSLAMGTNFHTTPNVWTSGSFTSTSNQVNWMSSSSSRTFYLTGVQLERNNQPTPFEQRPIGAELSLCQRYYYQNQESGFNRLGIVPTATTGRECPFFLPVTMRAAPTVTISDGLVYLFATGVAQYPTTTTAAGITTQGGFQISSGFSSATAGGTCAFDNFLIKASAEL